MSTANGVFGHERGKIFQQLLGDRVYVDWTGAALPPTSLIDDWHHHLRSKLIGNPHSHHLPSAMAMEHVNEARQAVLRYFNASPDEYDVIFTSGATAAILLLQHFMFEGGELLLTADNHNTVNGLREIARRNGAVVRYSPINGDLTLNTTDLKRMLAFPRSNGNRLFGFPAKSNYSGTEHDLNLVEYAQERGWNVLLDAAAHASNSRLNLSLVKPDFVPISFYKMFGFPTGVGCLIIKKTSYAKMHKRWFAGGSILLVSVMADFYAPETLGHARFEDGTVNFAQIPAIIGGLRFLDSLGDIKGPVTALASKLHSELNMLKDGGNKTIVHSALGNDIVTFSVAKGDEIVNAWQFEQAANEAGIYVRTGCFCNPGANECVFGYDVGEFERMYNDAIRTEDVTLDQLRRHSGGKPIGAIRASFGYANNASDVRRFVEFTKCFLRNL